jgi:hypothetical protein
MRDLLYKIQRNFLEGRIRSLEKTKKALDKKSKESLLGADELNITSAIEGVDFDIYKVLRNLEEVLNKRKKKLDDSIEKMTAEVKEINEAILKTG